MNDNFDNVLKQLKYHTKILNKHRGRSGAIGKTIANIEKAQLQLSRHPDTKADDVIKLEDRLTDQNMAEVSLFEVGEYSALKSRPGRDGMEMDHVPSKAALCETTCRYIEDRIDKKLNDTEVTAVLRVVEKLGGAIAVPKEMHNKLSRTIRGRNNEARIHQDSLDIIRAIKADVDAYTPELRRRGYSDNDIDMMYNNLVKHFKQFMEQLCRQK